MVDLEGVVNYADVFLSTTKKDHEFSCLRLLATNPGTHLRLGNFQNSQFSVRNEKFTENWRWFYFFKGKRCHERRKTKTSGRCATFHSSSILSSLLPLLSINSTHGSWNMTNDGALCKPSLSDITDVYLDGIAVAPSLGTATIKDRYLHLHLSLIGSRSIFWETLESCFCHRKCPRSEYKYFVMGYVTLLSSRCLIQDDWHSSCTVEHGFIYYCYDVIS